MKSNRNMLLAVACLALVALSCQAVSNLVGTGTTATNVPDGQNPQTGDVLLQDDFPPPAGAPAPTPTAQWNMQTENCR